MKRHYTAESKSQSLCQLASFAADIRTARELREVGDIIGIEIVHDVVVGAKDHHLTRELGPIA
jgi:hypothetical protein